MSSTRCFVYLWEFDVRQVSHAQFLRAYGPAGTWATLFARSDGYLGTLLLQDQAESLRYVTIDRWRSREAYDEFRARFSEEYEAMDAECEALTLRESSLGSYWQCSTQPPMRGELLAEAE